MKKINGMKINTVAQLLVERLSSAMGKFYFYECALGDNKMAAKFEQQVLLYKRYISYLVNKKGATLTCQDCGSVIDVKVVSDLRAAGTLCPHCLDKRLNRWAA